MLDFSIQNLFLAESTSQVVWTERERITKRYKKSQFLLEQRKIRESTLHIVSVIVFHVFLQLQQPNERNKTTDGLPFEVSYVFVFLLLHQTFRTTDIIVISDYATVVKGKSRMLPSCFSLPSIHTFLSSVIPSFYHLFVC